MGLPATTWVELVGHCCSFLSTYIPEKLLVETRDGIETNLHEKKEILCERAQKTLQKTSHNLKRDILLSANEFLCAPFVPSCGNGFGFMD